MDPTTCVARDPRALSCDLGGAAAILHLETGTYFTVNPAGSAVWEWLAETTPVRDLESRFGDRFGLTPERAHEDLAAFLDALHARGLVEERRP